MLTQVKRSNYFETNEKHEKALIKLDKGLRRRTKLSKQPNTRARAVILFITMLIATEVSYSTVTVLKEKTISNTDPTACVYEGELDNPDNYIITKDITTNQFSLDYFAEDLATSSLDVPVDVQILSLYNMYHRLYVGFSNGKIRGYNKGNSTHFFEMSLTKKSVNVIEVFESSFYFAGTGEGTIEGLDRNADTFVLSTNGKVINVQYSVFSMAMPFQSIYIYVSYNNSPDGRITLFDRTTFSSLQTVLTG